MPSHAAKTPRQPPRFHDETISLSAGRTRSVRFLTFSAGRRGRSLPEMCALAAAQAVRHDRSRVGPSTLMWIDATRLLQITRRASNIIRGDAADPFLLLIHALRRV